MTLRGENSGERRPALPLGESRNETLSFKLPSGEESWVVVYRAPRAPGGYRVRQYKLTEQQARERAAAYKRPHEAMRAGALYELRMAALEGQT
jgi:hypothetical protein